VKFSNSLERTDNYLAPLLRNSLYISQIKQYVGYLDESMPWSLGDNAIDSGLVVSEAQRLWAIVPYFKIETYRPAISATLNGGRNDCAAYYLRFGKVFHYDAIFLIIGSNFKVKEISAHSD
jgi:hypothetical protein